MIARIVSNPEMGFRQPDNIGRPIPYRLMSVALSRYLLDHETLSQAGVPDGDTLVISTMPPQNERLEKIVRLLSDTFEQFDGDNVSSVEVLGKRLYFTPSVFSVPSEGVKLNLVSVMMPYSTEFSEVRRTIQRACNHTYLECKMADDIWEHSVIVQDIFSLIFRSFIVVTDFTGRNPNVFYEAGIAHTLGKHVVPITQSVDDVPFDLRHHRFIKYLNNAEGRDVLGDQLEKRFGHLTGHR